MIIADSLRNLAANLATGGDKSAYSTYTLNIQRGPEAIAAYMTSILKKAVDIKAEDTFREWRGWQGDKAQIEALEREENRLGLKQKFVEADKLAQVTGGAAIFMGGLPGNVRLPVNVNSVTQGAWKYATVLPKERATATNRVTNPTDPRYGEPEYYMLGTEPVHPSRIIRFIGDELIDRDMNWDGYGASVYIAYETALKNLDLASTAVAAMIPEAKLDVFRIPNLTENFATEEYQTRLQRRLAAANMLKSITNALILDGGNGEGKGGEEFEQKTINFAGLPDIMDRFMLLFSAVVDIPQTRLYGRAPQGQNATGESDMQNWAQTVAARQELRVMPAINGADEILIRSSLGTRPAELWYDWRPIWTVSEKVGAEIEKAYAEGFSSRLNTGAIEDTVLAKSELNRMIESGRYPGIEDAIDESEADGGITDPEEAEAKEIARIQAEAEIAAASRPVAANDAAPRPLYVRRDVVNRAEISKWARSQGLTPVDDMHVTIVYSKDPVDWMKMGESWQAKLELPPGGPRVMELFGPDADTLVLSISSSELKYRHERMIELGASSDYPEYQPHITIMKDFAGDLAAIEPYRGKIVLGPEIFEDIKE